MLEFLRSYPAYTAMIACLLCARLGYLAGKNTGFQYAIDLCATHLEWFVEVVKEKRVLDNNARQKERKS